MNTLTTNRVLSFKAMARKLDSLPRVRLMLARALRDKRTREKLTAVYMAGGAK
jgi:hypothetical protein